jgi:hypothetical protein
MMWSGERKTKEEQAKQYRTRVVLLLLLLVLLCAPVEQPREKEFKRQEFKSSRLQERQPKT